MRIFSAERAHDHNGKTYVFRDVFEGLLLECQYKTVTPDGGVEWKPCKEGSEFTEVEPFQDAAA